MNYGRALTLFAMVLLIAASCGRERTTSSPKPESGDLLTTGDAPSGIDSCEAASKSDTAAVSRTTTEEALSASGYVDIATIDPSIRVSLIYATADNFVGRVLYHDLHRAFMLPQLAKRLKEAQKMLKEEHPDWSLIIYDAARPLSVQYTMWQAAQKSGCTRYVASPAKRNSLHCYGAAVDISIVDANGTPVDMGTSIDHFGIAAHITDESKLVADSLITEEAHQNRMLLRRLMTANGLLTIRTEWWHFELMRAAEAKRTLPIIE